MRRWLFVLLSLLVVVSLPAPSAAAPHLETDQAVPVSAYDPMLQASLARLSSGSRLWRDAVRALEGSGRRVLLLTSEQVRIEDRPGSDTARPFDSELLAETYPIVVSGSQVRTVLVVVNVALLREIYHSQPTSSPADVHRDVDRIVIHEVYGHALPYLLAGSVSGRCPDALPGERANDACAVRRENAVRNELHLGERHDAGLGGLALTRRAMLLPAHVIGLR